MRKKIARERCIFVTNANQQDVCQRSIADEVGLFRAKERFSGIKSCAASRDLPHHSVSAAGLQSLHRERRVRSGTSDR
jgi:hypothetical protein